MTLSEVRIRQLIERVAAGDEAAANSLIAGMRERILRWALVITGDLDDAEDVTQQVSLTLHKRVADFEARSRFTTWLYTVVRNTAVGMQRKQGNRRMGGYEDEVTMLPAKTRDRLDELHDAAAVRIIRGYFEQLPPRQRQLIELVDQQGYSAVEVAAALEIEPETARVHLMRARRTLRTLMLEQHPEMFE